MPGHKGRPLPLSELAEAAALDFTELPPTGDLFAGDGPIREAEALWAEAFRMDEALFLTGGSTQGVLSALTAACAPGERILLDRGCHRSAYNALALLDLKPAYLSRPWLAGAGTTGPVSPRAVENALREHPEIKTVCITSPTYYGVLSDIPAIAAVVHQQGGALVVDAAHGAHLPFLGDFDLAAADLAVVSAHKTLPALGQSAVLLARNSVSHGALRQAGSLYGSSSPSYLLMASLDACRAWMEDEGRAALERTARQTARLREEFPSLSPAHAPLDPCRFVLRAGDGFGVQGRLQALGVYPEMADRGHVVFIPSPYDKETDFTALRTALGEAAAGAEVAPAEPEPPEPPKAVLSPRQARFVPTETLPLRACEGRVTARQIAPYPPGVPVAAPGERLDKKHLAYLREIGYNMEEEIQVVPAALCVAAGKAGVSQEGFL